jgi:hypothetical protein
MLTLHALLIRVGQIYRITLLSEMPGGFEEIGFRRIPTTTWRAFLGASAEKRTSQAMIDSTSFDRDQPSRHYANRTHYRVRALKVTFLMDVEMLCITESTRRHRRNTTRKPTTTNSPRTALDR